MKKAMAGNKNLRSMLPACACLLVAGCALYLYLSASVKWAVHEAAALQAAKSVTAATVSEHISAGDTIDGILQAAAVKTSAAIAVTIGILAVVFFIMLRTAVRPVTKTGSKLASASAGLHASTHQIARTTGDLVESASRLSETVGTMTSSLEHLQSIIKNNTVIIQEADSLTQKTNQGTVNVANKMVEMGMATEEIKQNSEEIAVIMKVIDEIAFQTNLLALNAAVEAARAGEAGKGFAVVAEEVRNLAGRSAEAARKTADLLDKAMQSVSEGARISNEVLSMQMDAKNMSDEVSSILVEVKDKSHEQLEALDSLSAVSVQISGIVQRNAAASEQAAAASRDLQTEADVLSQVVVRLNSMIAAPQKKNGSAHTMRTGGQLSLRAGV